MCSAIVRGPTSHKIVPSVRRPAMSSICGPSAASITDGTVSVGRPAVISALQMSPVALTCPVSSSGSSTSRYSLMCRIGRSHFIFHVPSTDGWCDKPIPRMRRPGIAACVVRACAASALG